MGGGADATETTRASSKRSLTSDSQSPERKTVTKRSRVSRACDQCRSGRERCDGAQPVCQRCTSQRRDCSYNDQPKKRGIQPNYIRTLELTLAWLFQAFPECETRLASEVATANSQPRQLIAGQDAAGSESLHQLWRNGIICRQVDQLLSGSTVEVPSRSDVTGSTLVGTASGDTNGNLLGHENREAGLGYMSNGAKHSVSCEPNQPVAEGSSLDTGHLRLPDSAWTLLEYYFAFTHTWLPMTERQAILKLMYTYPASGISLQDASSGEIAELWSILALAASQMPGASAVMSEHTSKVARSLFPTERGPHEIGHVKGLLLLGLLEITLDQWRPAWVLIGSALRLLFMIEGSPANSGVDGQDARQRNDFAGTPAQGNTRDGRAQHVYLAAFVLETAVATYLRTPAYLLGKDVKSIGFVAEDGLDEWSPWQDPLVVNVSFAKQPAKSLSTLNRVVRLILKGTDHHAESSYGQIVMPDHVERVRTQTVQPLSAAEIISTLARNAREHRGRLLPSELISECEAGSLSLNKSANNGQAPPQPSLDFPASSGNEQNNDLDFMTSGSAYNENYTTREDVSDATLWTLGTSDALQGPLGDGLGNVSGSNIEASIFEELAMLERTDSSQQPQFLANLGYGPDLDLAEFFGDAYQPSDPLLAYMQPSFFDPAQGERLGSSNVG